MKFRPFLLLALVCWAGSPIRADQYQFTITGHVNHITGATSLVTVGDTFAAQLRVTTGGSDLDATAQVGLYHQVTAPLVHFSNGLDLAQASFDYMVVDSYYNPGLERTYDAIAFYADDFATQKLGFEIRLPVETFLNDSLQVPDNPISLADSNWFYLPDGYSGAHIFGSITSISAVAVPEPASVSRLLALSAILCIGAQKLRQPRTTRPAIF